MYKTRNKLFFLLTVMSLAILAIGLMGSVSAVDVTINQNTPGGLKKAIETVGNVENYYDNGIINSNAWGIGTIYMEDGVYSGSDNTNLNIGGFYNPDVYVRDLTIVGKGNNVVIDAKGINQIFEIEGTKLTLKNLKLINGKSNSGGGAISSSGDLTVIDCTFTNNKANYDGGAIQCDRLSMSGCTFTNNQAELNGGAISSSGDLTVIDCTFVNNKATKLIGGAISGGDSVTVSGCTFTNNQANYSCGAIAGGEKTTVKNSKFTNNKVTTYGGGAIGGGEHLTVSDCTFTNNRATGTGGAISGSSISVINCIFTDNQAAFGGAIYSGGDPNLSVSGSTFTNNQANSGGAIYFNGGGESDIISVKSCSFTNNQAKYHGGAIYHVDRNEYGLSFSVSSCSFTNNQANQYGGAIFSNRVKVDNSNFNNNKATKDGGAISINSYEGILRLDSVTFKNNMVGSKYNAIYSVKGVKIYKNKVTITPAENSAVPSAKKEVDLTIAKITKKGNYRHVTIKNIGKKATGNKFYLGVYDGTKQIKKVLVNSLGAGKSTIVKVPIAKKYENKLKTFKADSTNRIKESNKKNNSLKAR